MLKRENLDIIYKDWNWLRFVRKSNGNATWQQWHWFKRVRRLIVLWVRETENSFISCSLVPLNKNRQIITRGKARLYLVNFIYRILEFCWTRKVQALREIRSYGNSGFKVYTTIYDQCPGSSYIFNVKLGSPNFLQLTLVGIKQIAAPFNLSLIQLELRVVAHQTY